jgi:hypothetical protein
MDSLQVSEYAEWEREILERKLVEYETFLQRKDVAPRGRETAERVVAHLVFELMYREGAFDE